MLKGSLSISKLRVDLGVKQGLGALRTSNTMRSYCGSDLPEGPSWSFAVHWTAGLLAPPVLEGAATASDFVKKSWLRLLEVHSSNFFTYLPFPPHPAPGVPTGHSASRAPALEVSRHASRFLATPLIVLEVLSLTLLCLKAAFAGELKQAKPLSAGDVIALTLRNNPRVRLAVLDYQLAKAELTAAPMDFDYLLTGSTFFKNARKLSNSLTEDPSATEKSLGASLGMTKMIPLGTVFETSLQTIRTETNASTAFFKSYNTVAGLLKLTQPLLRGMGADTNEALERKTRAKVERYRWDLIETLNDELVKTLSLLWDYYERSKNLEMQKQALKTTQEIYDADRLKFRVGRKSRLELLESEAKIESHRAKVVLTEAELEEAREELTRQIFPASETLSPSYKESLPLVLQVNFEDLAKNFDQVDLSQVVLPDFPGENPKLRKLGFEVHEAQADVDQASNTQLPKLNWKIELLTTGLNVELGKAVSNAVRLKTPSWETAIVFEIPLGNNNANGDYRRTTSIRDRKEHALEEAKMALNSDIAKTETGIASSSTVWASIHDRLGMKKEETRIKRKMYEVGMISILDVYNSLDEFNELQQNEAKEFAAIQKQKLKLAGFRNAVAREEKGKFLRSLQFSVE